MQLFRRAKYDTKTDKELIVLYRKDMDNEIVGILYKRYGHMVMGTSMKYLKNKFDSEDLCMQIFEKLPSKIISNEIENFGGWLYQVTRNECLMKIRKKKIEFSDTRMETISEQESDLEIKELLEIRIQHLETAIGELKTEQRECIELFYLKKKSYEQISMSQQLDLKKVKSHIQNGKRNLKLIMEKNHA